MFCWFRVLFFLQIFLELVALVFFFYVIPPLHLWPVDSVDPSELNVLSSMLIHCPVPSPHSQRPYSPQTFGTALTSMLGSEDACVRSSKSNQTPMLLSGVWKLGGAVEKIINCLPVVWGATPKQPGWRNKPGRSCRTSPCVGGSGFCGVAMFGCGFQQTVPLIHHPHHHPTRSQLLNP